MLSATPSRIRRLRIEFEELAATPHLIARQYDYRSAGKIRIIFGAFLLFVYGTLIVTHEALERHGVYTFADVKSIMPLITGASLVGTFAGAAVPLSFNDRRPSWYVRIVVYTLGGAQICIAAYIALHMTGVLH